MKPIAAIALSICLASAGCQRKASKTICGCEETVISKLEYQAASMQEDRLTFKQILPTSIGATVMDVTARICNPDLSEISLLPPSTVHVVFTGEYFKGCDADRQPLVHLYDIVPAPRGFKDLDSGMGSD